MLHMKLSKEGAEFIKRGLWKGKQVWSGEDCRLTAYRDSGDVWTIGWGHTGPAVNIGLSWTQEIADNMFIEDVAPCVRAINKRVAVPLTQAQFDALVSFIYNVGADAFANSTLLKLLNAGEYAGAAEQFLRWNKDNGKVVAGLTRRRKAESALFLEKS